MKHALPFLALLAVASPVLAETQPRPYPQDSRIRWFSYDEHEVYRLDTYMRFITSIEFEPGENIESVQVGDSESWQIVRLDRGDILSVKPLIEGAYTNMTVYTNQRPYTFELRARSGQVGAPNLNYRVSFRYPGVEAQDRRAAIERAERPKDFNYYAAGDATDLKPVQVYDDGRRTIFVFPENARRPGIFLVGPGGRESIVNVRHAENASIVDRVSDRWTIRIGDEEICVAHGDVIRSVPGGRRAPQLGQGYAVYDPEIRGAVVTK
ncbi:TrbG/VirB9 family P-type conjugative transfer protein [uncultured Jannaschia sp.]|uniref:TrbG/VirB9 family P-type conjugative transfer protein n=1 Tax=uncultured Jannaschia sp. TaxID=293347 RepID=UPI002631B0E8|nr:TrbG/VirB9 family P-type conjugative transfer protein [uncultured Jannaschia sp.]